MKAISIITVIAMLSACDAGQRKPYERQPAKCKEVVSKKEATETKYKHVFSWWKGDFVLQPEIMTAYYLMFDDGSHAKVSMDKWAITDVGDSVQGRYPYNVCGQPVSQTP